ncbi:MAG: strictosidine synthase [Rubrivivax sp.]
MKPAPWTPLLDRLLGRGRHAVTVPTMDGALQPNRRLDEAPALARIAEVDNLVATAGGLLASSGAEVLRVDLDSGALQPAARFEAEVCALAALPDGSDSQVIAALAGGALHAVGEPGSRGLLATAERRVIRTPTALAAVDGETLLVAEGAQDELPSQWRADLLRGGRSGGVWRVALRDGTVGAAQPLATGLAWPCGLALPGDGSVVVSEAWAHRLLRIDAQGRRSVLLADLPGYPSRLVPAAGGGWWLSLFAPRSQLVEFVLREREFRAQMMATIDPRHWVAPALASGADFREPMQGGAIKTMGQLKPWAPTRSYGLVCRLDAQFQPAFSLHSRADGRRHGVTSMAEAGGRLHVACRGGGEIVSVEITA